jgi:hypothetical protein
MGQIDSLAADVVSCMLGTEHHCYCNGVYLYIYELHIKLPCRKTAICKQGVLQRDCSMEYLVKMKCKKKKKK